MRSTFRLLPVLLLLFAAALSVTPAALAQSHARAESMDYSDLIEAVESGDVREARVDPNTQTVTVELPDGSRHVAAVASPEALGGISDKLAHAGADVTVLPTTPTRAAERGRTGAWAAIQPLVSVLMIAGLIGAAWWYMRRRQQTGATAHGVNMSVGERAGGGEDDGKVGAQAGQRRVMFSDVAGCDEVVAELAEFRDFLIDPRRFRRMGAKMPGGALLYGPPGTGKTLLARALAGETNSTFIALNGADFVQMYVGVGAARVRDLFRRAREQQPAIVFIDEIDAIGRKRSGGEAGGSEERDQTLNALLSEMDGFASSNDAVVVLAATNRPEILDDALTRPGRLERNVSVDLPSEHGRLQILRLHAKGKPLAADVDLEALAAITAGCSGAELAHILNEAAIHAARRPDAVQITAADVEEGHDRHVAGVRKADSSVRDTERRTVAVHEAGHVVCGELCPTQPVTTRVTIQPRGKAAGFALRGAVDQALHTPRDLHEQIVCLLGGRAAEQVLCGEITSGAANDLEVANKIAREGIEKLGFSMAVGHLISRTSTEHMGVSDDTRRLIDEEVRRIVQAAYDDALRLVEACREQIVALADALLEREKLTRDEIVAVLGDLPDERPSAPFSGGQAAPRPSRSAPAGLRPVRLSGAATAALSVAGGMRRRRRRSARRAAAGPSAPAAGG